MPHKRRWTALVQWFDTSAAVDSDAGDAIDWLRVIPFIAMHVVCIGVIWVGVSPIALIVAGALYVLRMFAITAFYHRYFSHKAFKTSRVLQFFFAHNFENFQRYGTAERRTDVRARVRNRGGDRQTACEDSRPVC